VLDLEVLLKVYLEFLDREQMTKDYQNKKKYLQQKKKQEYKLELL
jgi:hypothetical protein